MQVLIEKTNRGYRASSGKPLEAETEAATRDEALDLLRDVLTRRLQGTVEVIDLEIPGELLRAKNPWLQGTFQDDPTFDEWQAAIRDSRQAEDEAAGIFPERNQ